MEIITDMFCEYPDVVTTQQLREMLSIEKTLMYKLLKNKVIKSRKIGRAYRIQKSEIIEYIKRQ